MLIERGSTSRRGRAPALCRCFERLPRFALPMVPCIVSPAVGASVKSATYSSVSAAACARKSRVRLLCAPRRAGPARRASGSQRAVSASDGSAQIPGRGRGGCARPARARAGGACGSEACARGSRGTAARADPGAPRGARTRRRAGGGRARPSAAAGITSEDDEAARHDPGRRSIRSHGQKTWARGRPEHNATNREGKSPG